MPPRKCVLRKAFPDPHPTPSPKTKLDHAITLIQSINHDNIFMYYTLYFFFVVFITNVINYLYYILFDVLLPCKTVSSMEAEIIFILFTTLSPEPSMIHTTGA